MGDGASSTACNGGNEWRILSPTSWVNVRKYVAIESGTGTHPSFSFEWFKCWVPKILTEGRNRTGGPAGSENWSIGDFLVAERRSRRTRLTAGCVPAAKDVSCRLG